MESFEIVPAGRVYANQLAPHLRMSDKVEIYASSGMNPLDALLESVEVSDEDMCWCATLNKHPVAMFGASHVEGETGCIWMLCSPAIYTNKLDFMRHCKTYLAKMHERYEYLFNKIDTRNLQSMQWLPALGFRPAGEAVEFPDYDPDAKFIVYVSKRS